MKKRLALALGIALALAAALAALTDSGIMPGLLRAAVWVELEPMPGAWPGFPATGEDMRALLEEEARIAFSGAIYGWTFVYEPSDPDRKVAERFDVSPVAMLPAKDPKLSVVLYRVDGNRVYLESEYRPDAYQTTRLDSFKGAGYSPSQGRGLAPVNLGPLGRREAFARAIKEAVRALLRPLLLNRPKRVSGLVALEEMPLVGVDAGSYAVKARMRIAVDEVLKYEVY